jgi:hypothetical protein
MRITKTALILVAAFALNLTAAAQSNTSAQAHQCPGGHTWVNTSWGGACVTNETAPPAATEPQHQTALPNSACQTGESWVADSFGGRCVNNAAAEELRQIMLGASRQREAEANKEAENRAKYEALQQEVARRQAWEQQEQQELQRQQWQFEQQLLKQQADIARRQMVLQYLMNRPTYTLPLLQLPVLPAYQAPQNNSIHCTTQMIGGTGYTNCY